MNDSGPPNPLLANFNRFYRQVATVKQAVAAGRVESLLSAPEEPKGSPRPSFSDARQAELISRRLRAFLDNQFYDVRELYTPGEIRVYARIRYLMAVLADEIFLLELPWTGRRYWNDCLLEKSLFGSSLAGTIFFERLDALLEKPRDRLHAQEAIVFLLALALGFKGRHRSAAGRRKLLAYSAKIRRWLGYGAPADRERRPMFHQAYEQRVSRKEQKRLTRLVSRRRVGLSILVVSIGANLLIHFLIGAP